VVKAVANKPLAVIGHRDVAHNGETQCPGDILYPRLSELVDPVTPPPPPPPPPTPVGVSESDIKAHAYKLAGAVVPDGALYKFAVANKLGAPVTGEYPLGDYVCQAYMGGIAS
jgi:hypothetical protein